MKTCKPKLAFLLLSLSGTAFASGQANEIPKQYKQNLDGYTQIVIDTDDEQKNPLIKVISIEIPASIVNTGQALNYVLYSSGFALKDLRQTDVETLKLYSLKVPLVNRSFFRVTVEQIIETLIGDAYVMNIDQVRREISIEARKK